jgi:hypothetical protein
MQRFPIAEYSFALTRRSAPGTPLRGALRGAWPVPRRAAALLAESPRQHLLEPDLANALTPR